MNHQSKSHAQVFAPAIAALMLAALSGPATVIAADDTPKFSALDTDGDGKISRSEAQAHSGLAGVFAAADANQDGSLDQAEFQTALQLLKERH